MKGTLKKKNPPSSCGNELWQWGARPLKIYTHTPKTTHHPLKLWRQHTIRPPLVWPHLRSSKSCWMQSPILFNTWQWVGRHRHTDPAMTQPPPPPFQEMSTILHHFPEKREKASVSFWHKASSLEGWVPACQPEANYTRAKKDWIGTLITSDPVKKA